MTHMCLLWSLLDNAICILFYLAQVFIGLYKLIYRDKNETDQLIAIALMCHCCLLIIHVFTFACVESTYELIIQENAKPSPISRRTDVVVMNPEPGFFDVNDQKSQRDSNIYELIRRQSSTRDSVLSDSAYQTMNSFVSKSNHYVDLTPSLAYESFPSSSSLASSGYDPLKVLG